MSLAARAGLRRQRQALQIAEKAKRMLEAGQNITLARIRKVNSPEGDAQAPDGLHLKTGSLCRSNPVVVAEISSILVQGACQ